MSIQELAQPLSEPMIALLRTILEAPADESGVNVERAQWRTARALEKRGFLSMAQGFRCRAALTIAGAAALAAHDRIYPRRESSGDPSL